MNKTDLSAVTTNNNLPVQTVDPGGKLRIPSSLSSNTALPDIVIGVDGVVLIGFLSWLFWKHVVYGKVIKRLDGFFRPKAEENRIREILPQIAILAGAHRVIFAGFHNGSLDSTGYHLHKITTLHTYLAPNVPAMAKPIKNLPIERIMYELVELFNSSSGWSTIQKSERFPVSCRAHLDLNSIYRMHNRLLKVGSVPIGILSIQYTDNLLACEMAEADLTSPLMEDLVSSLAIILQERITDPGVFKKILDHISMFS